MTNSAFPVLHLIVDEASTTRVRGWVMDPEAPDAPVFLRFRVNGETVWEGLCDAPRPDVAASHPGGNVGFAFVLPAHVRPDKANILTVESRGGVPLQVAVDGQGCTEVTLRSPDEKRDARGHIHSHIDSFRNGRIQGWVLRSVATPDGPRLLGGCSVMVVQDGRIVGQATADLPRPDVAQALRGEERCGFAMQIPRAQLSASVFRVLVMPDRQELDGSPCVLTSVPAAARVRAPAAAAKPAAPGAGRCAVCTVVRDEARDLPEWLTYQAAVGFDAVIAYENLSVDSTPLVLARAGRVMDVRVTPWPRTDGHGRRDAYQDCRDRFGREFDWIAFLDADEFLVPHAHPDIKALLATHESSAQIVVNRAVFGSGGRDDDPDGLIIESFTQRAPGVFAANRQVKGIVRPNAVRGVLNEHVMDVGDGSTVLADGYSGGLAYARRHVGAGESHGLSAQPLLRPVASPLGRENRQELLP